MSDTTTSDLHDRIQRFEYMAQADPDNEMAHFSLGGAYLQAGRAAEAAATLERCLELNPEMSKAYQLAGQAMIDAGWADRAVRTLERGYEVAAQKGDLMPRDAIAELLRSIGREPPALSAEAEQAAEKLRAAGAFVCTVTGRAGTQLDAPPMRGPLGEWIRDHVSRETWQEWIGQGTKVINELRLDFSREEDQVTFDRYMCEFLGIDPALYEKLTGEG
jgi:Fe-S cluster biosynthesis and repair protein YggX